MEYDYLEKEVRRNGPGHQGEKAHDPSHHKLRGDDVLLNMPLWPADKTYASVLFNKNKGRFRVDEFGGPAFLSDGATLPDEIEFCFPDYPHIHGLPDPQSC